MNKKIISIVMLILGFTIGASALSTLAAWTAPNSNPPVCIDTFGQPGYHPGCVRPINAGAETQAKLGLLGLQSFQFLPGLAGSVTRGHVLTALDENGLVGWMDPGAGSSQTIDDFASYTAPGSYTFTIPAGTKKLVVELWGSGNQGAAYSVSSVGSGYGGGGGGYGKAVFTITSETSCSVTVASANGNFSRVTCGSSSVTANGGGIPTGGTANSSGSAISSFLSIQGGSGGTPGGGGDAPLGGQGGHSGQSGSNCSVGNAPGGGGSGGVAGSPASCSGASGRVVISY